MRTVRGRLRHVAEGYLIDWIAAFLAAIGLGIDILSDFKVRALESCGSDFKTVYASAANALHGANAYTFTNLAHIFQANGVIEPANWYGHGPVYPPFTLVILTPLAAMPMVPAVYLWSSLSAIALGCALGSLARVAGEEFLLGRSWRLLLIALGAAFPLSGFGLELGNVSILVSALCILAVTASTRSRRWPRAFGLGVALVLKPHLAIWVLVAMLLMDNGWRRSLAQQAAAFAAGLTALGCLTLAVRGQFEMQFAAFREMLHSELSAGSMNAGNHEILQVPSQILSLDSLVGYFSHGEAVELLFVGGVLVLFAAALIWASSQRALPAPWRFPIVAAWSCFGMLATYHRGHDGVVLLLLLPWALSGLRNSWKNWQAPTVLCALLILSIDPTPELLRWAGSVGQLHWLVEFLVYRQAPLAALLLSIALLISVLGLVYARRAKRSLLEHELTILSA